MLQTQKLKQSTIAKRSVVIDGHKTSISLEPQFWEALCEIAERRAMSISELVSTVDTYREHKNLSSTLRVFVLQQCTG